MSDSTPNAELIAGFRQLRSVVQEWLNRDLVEPALSSTAAYADLMFAYAFARLSAKTDAEQLMAAALGVLREDEEYSRHPFNNPHDDWERWTQSSARRWIAGMFEFRIREALASELPTATLPLERIPPRPTRRASQPELRVSYVTVRARESARILEPTPYLDPYEMWKNYQNELERRIAELRANPHRPGLRDQLLALITELDTTEPILRLGSWAKLLPLANLIDNELRTRMLLRVANVVHETWGIASMNNKCPPDLVNRATNLLSQALFQAAGMVDAEYFPPLIDSVLRTLSGAKNVPDTDGALAELGWAALCWFRNFGGTEEAEMFLHATCELWPTGLGTTTLEPVSPQTTSAGAIHAGFLAFLGRDAEAALQFDAVSRRLAEAELRGPNRWEPRDFTAVAIAYSRGSTAGKVQRSINRMLQLFPSLRGIMNTWGTREYFSRLHLLVVESALLAFPAVRGV